MPMRRFSADESRGRARIRRSVVRRTTEADIARHAREDASDTAHVDFDRAIVTGRMRVVRPLDVAEIRAKTGLSQQRFAKAFQISPHTLRNWEQGRRVPEGPARALLMAIDRDPKALLRALRA